MIFLSSSPLNIPARQGLVEHTFVLRLQYTSQRLVTTAAAKALPIIAYRWHTPVLGGRGGCCALMLPHHSLRLSRFGRRREEMTFFYFPFIVFSSSSLCQVHAHGMLHSRAFFCRQCSCTQSVCLLVRSLYFLVANRVPPDFFVELQQLTLLPTLPLFKRS